MAGGKIGVGVGGSKTRSTNVSALAQRLAPPDKKSVHFAWFIFALPIGIWLAIRAGIWNKNEYPKLYAQWEGSWICHKCGNTFAL